MTYEYIHARRVAEMEYQLRLAEIELEEHKDSCVLPERNLITELMEAKVRLALFKLQEYAITHHQRSSRTQSQS